MNSGPRGGVIHFLLAFLCAWTCAPPSTLAQAALPSSPPPAPYSLPWLLRPATPASVLRLDETLAFLEDPASGAGGATYLTSLIATYRVNPRWVPIFRETFVRNEPPGAAPSGTAFSNPLFGIN